MDARFCRRSPWNNVRIIPIIQEWDKEPQDMTFPALNALQRLWDLEIRRQVTQEISVCVGTLLVVSGGFTP